MPTISNVIKEWSSKVDKIPDIIANRYEPLERLGQGGMGVVYRARDRLTGVVVALKQVLVAAGELQFSISDRSTNEALALALEFRTLATLRHPHIISVQDYGFDGTGHPFFTMEYLPDAQPITNYANGKSFDERLRLLTEMLQAIVYLHRRGIIHRDIKPGNILVNAAGSVKVLDFGLAVERDIVSASDDDSGEVAGTIAYMAPEILQGQPVGVASDLFAVGIIAYEMFAEQHPFNTSSVMALINDLMFATPDFERVDDEVVEFIEIMLSKVPEERPTSARDALAQLYKPLTQPPPEETAIIRESFLQASRFVGRKAELDQLTESLKAAKGGTSSGWLIGGESGVGKSRLVDEVRVRALVEGVRVVRGQGVSEGGVPYQLWRGVLRPLVISTDLSDLEASVLKTIVPDIDTLLGQPVTEAEPLEGEANQQRLAVTIVDVFKRQVSPTLIILEDLQWSEEGLEPLKALVRQLDDLKLMLLGTYRADERPNLPQEIPEMQPMRLRRLESKAVEALSVSMLGDTGRDPALVNLINRETEGNVFFIVEVVRALAEEAGRLDAIGSSDLPARVMAGGMLDILRRRLARLPDWAQEPLQLAAVVGRQLDAAVIQAASPGLDFEAWLTAGANAAVFDVADGVWLFSHDKLRETLLYDMAADALAATHGTVAGAIETTYPNDESYAEVLANHWDAAGEGNKALPHILTAADRMVHISGQYEQARSLLERGRVIAGQGDGRTLSKLEMLLGDVAQNQSDYIAALENYQRSLEMAGNDPSLQIAARYGLGMVDWRMGNVADAKLQAEASYELAVENNDDEGMADSLNLLALVEESKGNFQKSLEHLRQSLRIRRKIGSLHRIGATLNLLGTIYMDTADYDDAIGYFQQSLEIHSKLGAQLLRADILTNLGTIASYQQNYDTAATYLEEALELFTALNVKRGIALVTFTRGDIELSNENYELAIQQFGKSTRAAREINDSWQVILGLVHEAKALIHIQRYMSAREKLLESIKLATETNIPPLLLMAVVVCAYLFSAENDAQQAAELVTFAEQHPAMLADVNTMWLQPLKQQPAVQALNISQTGDPTDLASVVNQLLKSLDPE